MNPKNLQEVIERILDGTLYMFLGGVATLVVLLVLKQFAVAFVNWRNARNADIGIGAMFHMDGEVWVLDHITFTRAELRCLTKKCLQDFKGLSSYGMVRQIPLQLWNKQEKTILYPSGKAVLEESSR